jgi:hypothetical protein
MAHISEFLMRIVFRILMKSFILGGIIERRREFRKALYADFEVFHNV